MKSMFVFVLLLPFLALQGQNNTMLLKNIRVVDVKKGEVSEPTRLLVENGVIQAIGKQAGRGFTGEILELEGAYVLPGLINAHVHLGNDPDETWESRYRQLTYLVKHGITSVRDAAGDARILKKLQQQVQEGKVTGPDICYAAFLAGPSYYKGNDREKNMVVGLDTAYAPWLQCIRPGDDLNRAMEAARGCGATGIKIYGGFSREELIPLVEAGKKAGLEIWGHAALFPAKPIDVAEAGVEVLSHAYLLEWEGVKEELSDNLFENCEKFYSGIDHEHLDIPDFIAAMKKRNAIFDPTLFLCMENQMEWSALLVRQLYQAGVKICAGTDWIEDPSRPYPFLLDEIGLYVEKCGFTPLDAIRSATIVAAETIGMEHETGSIEKGKRADLLILNNNPLENIEHLKEIRMVIKSGQVITHQEYRTKRNN